MATDRKLHRTRVLIVDDDPLVIKTIRAALKSLNWDILAASDGLKALNIIETSHIDVVLLDILLPEIDGLDTCLLIRERTEIPIIMVSALHDTQTKVGCLDRGADDYLTKPFSLDELIARIKSVLRRSKLSRDITPGVPIIVGDIKLNPAQRKFTVSGEELRLTPTEYFILYELMINAGKVLTHSHLLGKVWGPEYGKESEYLHVFVNRIRAKLNVKNTNKKYITSIPRIGYVLNSPS